MATTVYDVNGQEITLTIKDLDPTLVDQIQQAAIQNTGNVTVNPINHVPFIPVFTGSENASRSEVSYEYWSHVVKGILNDKAYPVPLVKQAIRKSLRGEAAQILLQLPADPDVDTIVDTLGEYYGKVITKETSWQMFFSATQSSKETIVSWKSRLESLMYRATLCGTLTTSEREERLKNQFWSGLYSTRVKEASRHVYDSNKDLSELFKYCRAVEQSISSTKAVNNVTEKPTKSETSSKTETTQKEVSASTQSSPSQQETYWKQKYLDLLESLKTTKVDKSRTDMSKVKCYLCKKYGHVQRYCPDNHANTSLPRSTQSRQNQFRYKRSNQRRKQPQNTQATTVGDTLPRAAPLYSQVPYTVQQPWYYPPSWNEVSPFVSQNSNRTASYTIGQQGAGNPLNSMSRVTRTGYMT